MLITPGHEPIRRGPPIPWIVPPTFDETVRISRRAPMRRRRPRLEQIRVAPAYVQSNDSNTNPASPTATTAFTGAQSAKNTNLVFLSYNTAGNTINSVQDTTGNIYDLIATSSAGAPGSNSGALYYAYNIGAAGAGANTVTVTYSGSQFNVLMIIAEYSGLAWATNPLDNSGTGTSDTLGAATSGTVTINSVQGSGELLASFWWAQSQVAFGSPATGFTWRDTAQSYIGLEDMNSTAGGNTSITQTWNGGVSSQWWGISAAFLPPGAGGSPFGGCAYEC